MLLFESDWKKYPNAIVDFDTSNKSTVRYVGLLKKMGVKNCLWPLALFQPQLVGVDPHDESLSEEVKLMILTECYYNPWYYFREVARVPPTAGIRTLPLEANRGNMTLFWLFFNHIDTALIQPRQTGKSLSTDILSVQLQYIILRNTKMMLITKDDGLRRNNIERLKGIRDLLPTYLIPHSKTDADNQSELTCNLYNNKYATGVSQSNESGALKLGRGLTVPIVHFDEAAFINHIATTLPAALASGSASRDEAELNGEPYGNIFTTTAGKKDDRDGRYMFDFITGGAFWNEIYFDCKDQKDLHNLILTNCTGRKLLINATFSHRQLGKTDEWLYRKITEANATKDEADRDFFNRWTSGTQSSPLSSELSEIIRDSDIDPLYSEITNQGYILRWYVEEERIKSYMDSSNFIIGLDTSEAIGRDAIALEVVDIKNLGTVCSSAINETNLVVYSKFLSEFMIKYPKTTLIIEKKSTAQNIVDHLILEFLKIGIDPFKRIYNRIVDEADGQYKEEYKVISNSTKRIPEYYYERYRKTFGFNTAEASRSLLYGKVLQNMAKMSGSLVKDKLLSSQILGLVVKNGKIDHTSSGNDDLVIAWLLAGWLCSYGKNLGHYGINSSEILVDRHQKEDNEDPALSYERQKQDKIQKEILETYELLKNAKSDVLIMKYEHRLQQLNTQVKDVGGSSVSIDEIIQKAKIQRNRRVTNQRQKIGGLDAKQIWGGRR